MFYTGWAGRIDLGLNTARGAARLLNAAGSRLAPAARAASMAARCGAGSAGPETMSTLVRSSQLAMATWWCTVAGSPSVASMQAARSAQETVNPCGRLRSIAVR